MLLKTRSLPSTVKKTNHDHSRQQSESFTRNDNSATPWFKGINLAVQTMANNFIFCPGCRAPANFPIDTSVNSDFKITCTTCSGDIEVSVREGHVDIKGFSAAPIVALPTPIPQEVTYHAPPPTDYTFRTKQSRRRLLKMLIWAAIVVLVIVIIIIVIIATTT